MTKKLAESLEQGDLIATEHGSNFGTFEVESVTFTYYEDGTAIVELDGYQSINAGVCGPAGRSYRAGELVELAAVRV